MISQREKGIYLSFCTAQIVLALLLFGLFYLANDFFRNAWLPAPSAYLQIMAVMLVAMAMEAATRPDAQRVNAGRAQRRPAMGLSRRQSLWVAGGFALFIALTRDTTISRLFLVGLSVLTFPLFYITNRHGRHWLFKVFRYGSLRMKLRTVVIGSEEWTRSVQEKIEGFRDFFDPQPAIIVRADEPAERILAKVSASQPDLLVLPSATAAVSAAGSRSRSRGSTGGASNCRTSAAFRCSHPRPFLSPLPTTGRSSALSISW
jgi:hypothetical protein